VILCRADEKAHDQVPIYPIRPGQEEGVWKEVGGVDMVEFDK